MRFIRTFCIDEFADDDNVAPATVIIIIRKKKSKLKAFFVSFFRAHQILNSIQYYANT